MSLKENIAMVKEELNSEEKFFEKAVVTERFVKKYKNLMIASVVAVIVLVGGNMAYESNENAKIVAANNLLNQLQKDPSNSVKASELNSLSPALFDVWMFSQATVNNDTDRMKKLQNSKALIVSDLAKYELAKDVNSLDEYSSSQSAIFRDLALVQSAILLLNENKIDEAHNQLVKVSKESSLSKIASALLHYGIK
ncbi:MAG: hypothetical protein DRG78_21855 [Epsilonproteobacteria bacterium]|nr:MAG: hypothetical protein DRG78_21855 [Campylobacterota bacterium]